MNQDLIFAPMGVLAALTFGVQLLIPFRRFRAAARRQVTTADFRFGESASVPGEVSIPNRNYMNLLELPTLFFAICLMFYVTERADTVILTLAWAYVVLRAVHSLVHVTYNNVIHRLSVFALSSLVLSLLWLLFFFKPG